VGRRDDARDLLTSLTLHPRCDHPAAQPAARSGVPQLCTIPRRRSH